ncbi:MULTISPECIES: hypothetical protein [Haloferacaceae]|uniref:Uncharacterized protein n=1 Tax=Halorubrum glutamatedens TaxID=2707018 RepID=A0ABD5QPW0_9EURY|nr:hypothetical protein [Halobellus captivus]
MSYDPAIVGRYGNLVEKWAAKKYPLELDYPMVDGLTFDAIDEKGRPWDVTGSMTNDVRPTFKLWEDQHETLVDADGGRSGGTGRRDGRLRSCLRGRFALGIWRSLTGQTRARRTIGVIRGRRRYSNQSSDCKISFTNIRQ